MGPKRPHPLPLLKLFSGDKRCQTLDQIPGQTTTRLMQEWSELAQGPGMERSDPKFEILVLKIQSWNVAQNRRAIVLWGVRFFVSLCFSCFLDKDFYRSGKEPALGSSVSRHFVLVQSIGSGAREPSVRQMLLLFALCGDAEQLHSRRHHRTGTQAATATPVKESATPPPKKKISKQTQAFLEVPPDIRVHVNDHFPAQFQRSGVP